MVKKKRTINSLDDILDNVVIIKKDPIETKSNQILETTNRFVENMEREINEKIDVEFERRKEEEIKKRFKKDESEMSLNEWLFLDTHRSIVELEQILKASM